MTFKTILAAASGGSASAGTLDLACRLALRFGAHLEGFHVRIDPNDVMLAAGDGFGLTMPVAWLEEMATEAAALSARMRAAFDDAVGRHGLAMAGVPTAPSAAWREETGQPAFLLPSRARFFDLAVLGRSERVVERPSTAVIEATLLQSGRPLLLAPEQPPATIGAAVAFGWDGSPTALRALAAALPFMAPAGSLSLITIGESDDLEIPSILEYLAWHKIAAKHHPIAAEGKPGRRLLAEAGALGADLLVMGGYGHASWREQLFGGATQDVIGAATLPILMVH